MSVMHITQLARELLWLVLILSLPVIIVTSLIGVVVGLIQALTQIQDQTVAFALKLISACITLVLTYHWMGEILLSYTTKNFGLISGMRQ